MSDTTLPSAAGPPTNPTTRFERQDVNTLGVAVVGAILAAVVVVGCFVSWWVFDFLQARDRARKVSPFPLAVEERGRLPAEPRLEEVERMEAAKNGQPATRLYSAELDRLDRPYGWVDEEKKIAHIPIDQAMELIVEQKRLRSRPDAANADK
jgi:hypothetical protein